MYYNPVSGNAKISASYRGFSAVEIAQWSKQSNNLFTFTLPRAVSAGYIDVIAFNEAGYGKLMTDAVRPTLNPYVSGTTEYNNYIEYQHPSISGINVGAFYDYC